ncbi:MAG: DMT family transporter [Actinomycetota bacterium]
MAIVLALVTAASFGVADFCGGLASRRATALQVVAGSHVVGGIGVVIASLVLAERFDGSDAVLGVLGGACGMIGVILLYRRLAAGPMSVVAPLTGVTSAVVPAVWGLAGGERLGVLGLVGLLVGLLAVLLVSLTPDGGRSGDRSQPVTAQVVLESLAAGLGFGTLFIFFDATSGVSSPWPVATARIFTSSLLVATLVVLARLAGSPAREIVPRRGRVLALIAGAGLADTLANVTFLTATEEGQLAVVSVLSSLYPISTVLLARVVLSERMTRPQGLGFLCALAATVLLTIG